MQEYIIGNKSYYTICSIHDELKNIFKTINELNPKLYKDQNELYNKISDIIKFGIEFADIAKEMGCKMESGLRQKNLYGPQENIYNLNGYFQQNDED
jgi:hypothetical protein